MVTRTISLKSEEGQEPEAKEAVSKEVAYHVERGTWDLSRVRELSEWMRDDAYSEVLVGRVFVTLGVKFADKAKSERKFRARAVYQGNNIRSRSGRSVYEIFDEVSNSPSFVYGSADGDGVWDAAADESFLRGRHKCLLAGLA